MPDSAFATVVTGVTVFVVGQAAKAVFVDPIMGQRKVIGEIEYNLTYLAQWYANPAVYERPSPEQRTAHERAGDTLRQYASRLQASVSSIACYGAWECTTWVPPRAAVRKAVGDLILLSNSIYRNEGSAFRLRISAIVNAQIAPS